MFLLLPGSRRSFASRGMVYSLLFMVNRCNIRVSFEKGRWRVDQRPEILKTTFVRLQWPSQFSSSPGRRMGCSNRPVLPFERIAAIDARFSGQKVPDLTLRLPPYPHLSQHR